MTTMSPMLIERTLLGHAVPFASRPMRFPMTQTFSAMLAEVSLSSTSMTSEGPMVRRMSIISPKFGSNIMADESRKFVTRAVSMRMVRVISCLRSC